MDRRKSLKAIALGTVSAGVLLDACKTEDAKPVAKTDTVKAPSIDRMKEETEKYNKLIAEKFFTAHEMATIAVLTDIIIPADEKSGSATDAKVPDFIEFIVKDQPDHQTPIRGGLSWLDVQSNKRFHQPFVDCSAPQQIELVDDIAYPEKVKPGMKQGIAFFSHLRNLTASGFYTTEMGIKDIGYIGNKPSQWNGVPDDVLKEHGLSYTEKELKECVSF